MAKAFKINPRNWSPSRYSYRKTAVANVMLTTKHLILMVGGTSSEQLKTRSLTKDDRLPDFETLFFLSFFFFFFWLIVCLA